MSICRFIFVLMSSCQCYAALWTLKEVLLKFFSSRETFCHFCNPGWECVLTHWLQEKMSCDADMMHDNIHNTNIHQYICMFISSVAQRKRDCVRTWEDQHDNGRLSDQVQCWFDPEQRDWSGDAFVTYVLFAVIFTNHYK